MLNANLYLLLRTGTLVWLNSKFAVRRKVFTLLTFNFTIQLFTADRYPLKETSVVFILLPFFPLVFSSFSLTCIVVRTSPLHLTSSMPRVFAMRCGTRRGERNKRFRGDKIHGRAESFGGHFSRMSTHGF